jgi:dihydropteroate synthase
MGVVNTTPDSFSDGGMFLQRKRACEHVDELLREGADLIDIGGESTRPGSGPVPADEQIRRTREVVKHAVMQGALVSIDTTQPRVALAALEAGAQVVNDVSCLRDGDELARVAAAAGASLILMHAREPMATMKGFSACPDSAYIDVVRDVVREWRTAEQRAEAAGVPRDDVLFDPGLGFNKNARHSSEIVARLDQLTALGWAVVVGPSRKSFLAAGVASEPRRRLGGTVAACLACAARGAAVLRVHDVLDVRQALAVAWAVGLLPPTAGTLGHG